MLHQHPPSRRAVMAPGLPRTLCAAASDMKPPEDYPRSFAHIPPGTWSDDGSLLLALLEYLRSRLLSRVVGYLDRFLASGH